MEADFLIISNQSVHSFTDLFTRMECRQIILDGTNKMEYYLRLKQADLNQENKIHFVLKDGAYVTTL